MSRVAQTDTAKPNPPEGPSTKKSAPAPDSAAIAKWHKALLARLARYNRYPAQANSVAVVAPGIAEALLATALGLVAAIPAVVVYNLLARLTAQYRALLGDASAQIITLASRDIERAKEPASQAAE